MSDLSQFPLPEEAGNPTTSVERLTEISALLHLRAIVAGNSAAPANLLAYLAQDQDAHVRQAVAGNPSTPWRTLEHLAWEFPRAFLHNPVGSLQMLARPERISTDGRFWDALLRETSIPSLWWSWLRSQPALGASQAVRLHAQYAGETTHPYGVPQEEEESTLLTLVELLTSKVVCTIPLSGGIKRE